MLLFTVIDYDYMFVRKRKGKKLIKSSTHQDTSDHAPSVNGSDDLFPSLERLLITNNEHSSSVLLLKPCFVCITKLTEVP